MKGANRHMKLTLVVFAKKFLFKEMEHFGSENGNFGSENGTSSEIWIDSKNIFKFCTMKGANRWIEIMLMAFPKQSC